MGNKTLSFDDFSDHFELAVDEIDVWPAIAVELIYILHPPEPDVGLFDPQPEVTGATYYVDDVEYENFDEFAAAAHERIAEDIVGDADDVVEVLRDWLNEQQGRLGEDET